MAKKIVATVRTTENMGDHGIAHEIPFGVDPMQSVQALVDDWASQYGAYAPIDSDPMNKLHEHMTLTLRVIEVPE